MNIRLGLLTLSLLLVASPVTAQQQEKPIPKGAFLYIEEMENDLDGYIRAEIVKRKAPLTIVLKPEEADLVMTGSTAGREAKWHEGWLTPERDKHVGNITVIDRRTQKFLWASEAGDRSWSWGALRRGGQRKVAERLVKNLKKAISHVEPMVHRQVEEPVEEKPPTQQVTPSAPATADWCIVEVNSVPQPADVEVNSKFVGNTPTTLKLVPGDYEVVVKKAGFKEWKRTVSALAGNTLRLIAELEKQE